MFCKNCGKEIDRKTKFCPNCESKNDTMSIDAGDMPDKTLPSIDKEYTTRINNSSEKENAVHNVLQENNTSTHKPNNKGLKTAFFILLGVSLLLAVGIFIALFLGIKSPPDIGSVLNAEPKVEDEVKTDWGKGAYSLNNIGQIEEEQIGKQVTGDQVADISSFSGVWRLDGLKTNLDDNEYYEKMSDDSTSIYAVLDTRSLWMIHYITIGYDKSVLNHEKYPFTMINGVLHSQAPKGSPEGVNIQYHMNDGDIYGVIMLDDKQISEWAVYVKSAETVQEMLDIAASTQETERMDEASDTSEQQIVYMLESEIIGAWENQDGDDYIGMHFFDNGTVRYYENLDGKIYDTTMEYKVLPENEIMINNNPENIIVTTIENNMKTEATILHMTVDGETTDLWNVAALCAPNDEETVIDIEEFICNTAWISTGNEYTDESSTNVREYDLAYGDIVYTVENGIISHSELSSEYIIDPTGEIMYAFHREEELDDGKVHSLYSAFFIEDGLLYEIEFIDDILVSNIIEYERYEP